MLDRKKKRKTEKGGGTSRKKELEGRNLSIERGKIKDGKVGGNCMKGKETWTCKAAEQQQPLKPGRTSPEKGSEDRKAVSEAALKLTVKLA